MTARGLPRIKLKASDARLSIPFEAPLPAQ